MERKGSTCCHTLVAGTRQDSAVRKRRPNPTSVGKLFIIDSKKLLEWEDSGPALPEVDVWPSNEKVIGYHGAIFTYANGTNLWVAFTVLNWQQDTRAWPHCPQRALQSITKHNQYGS